MSIHPRVSYSYDTVLSMHALRMLFVFLNVALRYFAFLAAAVLSVCHALPAPKRPTWHSICSGAQRPSASYMFVATRCVYETCIATFITQLR